MIVLSGLGTVAHWAIEAVCMLLIGAILWWIAADRIHALRSWRRRRNDVRTARSYPIPDLHDAYVAQAKAAQVQRQVSGHGNPNDCRCDRCLLVIDYLKVIADRADWDGAYVRELEGA